MNDYGDLRAGRKWAAIASILVLAALGGEVLVANTLQLLFQFGETLIHQHSLAFVQGDQCIGGDELGLEVGERADAAILCLIAVCPLVADQ